jgi:diacylglycerol diphosphate phosphatase/phosphatidate phosphatase
LSEAGIGNTFIYQCFVSDIYCLTAVAFSLASILTYFFTAILKYSTGRLRPDFLDRCKPETIEDGIVTSCGGNAADIVIGRLSFPSGHTAQTFAGQVFLMLFLAAHLNIKKNRGNTLVLCTLSLPLIASLLVNITRICDYRHHWSDVVVGAMIGSLFAVLGYHMHFSNVTHKYSTVPLRYANEGPEEQDMQLSLSQETPQSVLPKMEI